MDEENSPSSERQFSAGFIVMDSQTESMDGDIMQYLPALNQSNGVAATVSTSNTRLFQEDQSCDEDKQKDSPKGQILVTDSEFEHQTKKKVDINTSSDDVVSESEEGDITVIEKLPPDDTITEEKVWQPPWTDQTPSIPFTCTCLKRKRGDSDSDDKVSHRKQSDEDDPGSSFHSTGRENLGSYNQAELSQGHCRGNRLPAQDMLSQTDMFADIAEEDGSSSSQSDHISCLQLSNKPMLVPETVDESSPTELPPSPNAASIHIIPSSPTDGSFQDTSISSNNDGKSHPDTSATSHESGVDLGAEEEYNPFVSATLAEEDPKSRKQKNRSGNVNIKGVHSEYGNDSEKDKGADFGAKRHEKEGQVRSEREGAAREEKEEEYDPGGISTLARAEPGHHKHGGGVKNKNSSDSDKSVIRIEDTESSEIMEVISINSTQDKDLSESQHYSLHLSPSQPSQMSSTACQGKVPGSQSLIANISRHDIIQLSQGQSQGEQIQTGTSSAKGPSQVEQNVGGYSQTRESTGSQKQKGLSQGIQTPEKLIQGRSQGGHPGSQQGHSQGLWHTPGKTSQMEDGESQGRSNEGIAMRQNSIAASQGHSQQQIGSGQGHRSSPSVEVTMVTTVSQNSIHVATTSTTKLANRGDSQEAGPSHAVTPPLQSVDRYQTESEEIKVETMDLAFSLERPQIEANLLETMSEDSRTEVFRRNKDRDTKKSIIKEASDDDENLAFQHLSGDTSSVKSEAVQGDGQNTPSPSKTNIQRSVYSEDTIPSDVSTAIQTDSIQVLGSQPTGLQKVISVSSEGSQMPRIQKAMSSDTEYKANVEDALQQSQIPVLRQSQSSEDTELYVPGQIQGGNVSQITTAGVRVPSQSLHGIHPHSGVYSQEMYVSQGGTVSQAPAVGGNPSQSIHGNLPIHLQGMMNMSQGGVVSQVPTIVGGPYQNISGHAQVPANVPTCTYVHNVANSQGLNTSQNLHQISQNTVVPQQTNVNLSGGRRQQSLSRESQDEIRDWLTNRPTFSDPTFQERNMNTYSAYKARKASQKKTPVKAATQERVSVPQIENMVTATDPYTFHGSQSQGMYQHNPADLNTTGMTLPVHQNPIPPAHHETPVSSRKKKRPATRKKVTTRTRQHPVAKVHFSDQIAITSSAAMETGAIVGQSMRMPMISPSTSSSSDKSPRITAVQSLQHSSFISPTVQSPHGAPLAPPTSVYGTLGRGRVPDSTPSSISAPEVDLSWVFTPSPSMAALVNLAEKSDVQQKNAIIAQMSGHPSFEIVNKIAVTGTVVKHFILREKYHGGVRKGCMVEEEEDKADVRTKYRTEVIPPVDYISPSRSTSTVSTGDLGDISSFSSGSIKSNMERSGSSLETTASLTSTVAAPVDTSRGTMVVSSSTSDPDVVMTTSNTAQDLNVITIAPLPTILPTTTAPSVGDRKCSTPREAHHKGTPSLSPKQSLPSSVETEHSPQEASTIERSGSRLFDETHQSSDLFAGTSETSVERGDTDGGKVELQGDQEETEAVDKGKKQKGIMGKRGRGRPRKSASAAAKEEALEKEDEDEADKEENPVEKDKSTSGSDKVRKVDKQCSNTRNCYTLERKLDIITYAEKHGNRAAGRMFEMSEGNVRSWRKKKDVMRSFPAKEKRRIYPDNLAKFPEIESLLLSWLVQKKERGENVTLDMVCEEARRLGNDMEISNFKASWVWASRMLKRHNVCLKRKEEKQCSNTRNCYTVEKKLDIITYAEKHGNRAAGRMFKMSESNVRSWRKRKDWIQSFPAKEKRRIHVNSLARFPELESLLLSWLEQEREQGKKVTIQMICQEARRLANDMEISNFKACFSWAINMLKRHNAIYHKRTCKKKNFGYKSREQKLQVLAYAEKHGKQAAMEHFFLSEACVRNWMKMKASLQQQPDHEVKPVSPSHGTKVSKIKESLDVWINEEKAQGVDLTLDDIMRKAKHLGIQVGLADVRISDSWVSNYLKAENSEEEISPSVPYQDEQSKEASGEEIGSGIIHSKPVIGARVIAKWKDKFYYPGAISRVDKVRFQVKFDDGDVLLIKPQDLLLIERLPIGQPVMVPTGPEAFYEGALIVGHVRQGGRTHYTVEQDGGVKKQFRSSQVILNEDQADSLVKDTNCVRSGPVSTTEEKIADVTLDNLVEGKRRTGSRYEQGEVDNPPAPASTQGRKRKYKVDVPPSATSTPTPNRVKRHKGEDQGSTPRFGYTADSPVLPRNTRRSPRKSRAGLFDSTPAPTENIFKGMVFLLTYVEKSSEDKKVEKDFLKDLSLSSDESASESATEELVPFDKARIKNEIEAAGGTVLASFDKDQIPSTRQCFLISNTYQRTVKYFQSLAAAIPCVSHLWIHHSVAQEKLLDYHSYMLQAGISIEKKKIMEWNSRRGALEGLCVLVTSSDSQFKQQWSSVLDAAGCHIALKLPSSTSERPVNVVLTDKTCSKTELRKFKEVPVIGCEWVIQCLINGQRMAFDGHQHYKYDHQS